MLIFGRGYCFLCDSFTKVKKFEFVFDGHRHICWICWRNIDLNVNYALKVVEGLSWSNHFNK